MNEHLIKNSEYKEFIQELKQRIQSAQIKAFEVTLPTPQSDLAKQIVKITQSLPDDLKSSLPSIEEIEAEFGGS
jgi:hypothetical protein